MKPIHRWFQYSLRSFLVILTALAVWLGVVAHQSREQREAVKAIEAMGGYVIYDWQWDEPAHKEPPGPAWLRRLIGDDFFQNVKKAGFNRASDATILTAIPQLQRLHGLETVGIPFSHVTPDRVRAALPQCDVSVEF